MAAGPTFRTRRWGSGTAASTACQPFAHIGQCFLTAGQERANKREEFHGAFQKANPSSQIKPTVNIKLRRPHQLEPQPLQDIEYLERRLSSAATSGRHSNQAKMCPCHSR